MIVEYRYDEMEEALERSDRIKKIFQREKVYISHKIELTKNKRIKIIFIVDDSIGPVLHKL